LGVEKIQSDESWKKNKHVSDKHWNSSNNKNNVASLRKRPEPKFNNGKKPNVVRWMNKYVVNSKFCAVGKRRDDRRSLPLERQLPRGRKPNAPFPPENRAKSRINVGAMRYSVIDASSFVRMCEA
jgi:hypothetical protein